MADTIEIVQGTATTIEIAGLQGPQGPQGATGSGLGTLTTQGDTLYQGASAAQRLPIGTAGQILKVAASGIPEWGNESGAVSSVAGRTGAVTLHSTDISSEQALEVYEAGTADCNGLYIYGGLFNGRPTYYATKNAFIYWDGSNWIINHNGEDQYFGTAAIRPWDSIWSLGEGSNPLPVVDQVSSRVFEQVVGERTNPTAFGTASVKNVGTGANDVAAGNHTHGNLTNSGAVGTTANLPLKTGTNGVVEAGAFGTAAGSFCEGNDARLSDDRDPNLHAASHLPDGADELFDQDLNTTNSVTFVDITGATITADNLSLNNPTNGNSFPFSDSIRIVDSNSNATADFIAQEKLTANRTYDLPNASGTLALQGAITTSGLTQATARILGRTSASTGAVEEITVGSGLSLSAGELSATGSGVTAVGASTADVLSVSGSDLVADDAGADRIIFWDDSESKLRYLEAGSGLTISGTTLTATGGGVTAVGTSTADVLSVSGSDLVADDGGTIDSADPFIKWNDTAGKLVYANPLSRPSGAFYVGLAPTTTALGTNAVYIGPSRTNENQVASGVSSVCIGQNARATGLNSTAVGFSAVSTVEGAISIGNRNTSSAFFSTTIGQECGASGEDSVAIGGYGANATSNNAVAIGKQTTANLRSMFSTRAFNSVYWGGQTTNATPLILNLDATATNRFTIAASTALAVDILLVARRSDTQDKWLVARRFLGIRRDGSNNTSLIGSVQTLGVDQSAGSPTWTFALTADDTNEALQLEVTGAASETIQWRATAFYRVA
jgi:hypothetical protein